MTAPFLTARWENLVLLNFRCSERLLAPLVPRGTQLDAWEGQHLVSLVGFQFTDTRVRGIAFPGHRSFEEVNLRFYVCRKVADELRRGVVFIRELVPRRLIAAVARIVYNEPYSSVPMSHAVRIDPEAGGSASYSWRHRGHSYRLSASASGACRPLVPGSEAEFITEHYWGYNKQRDGGTLEYRVEHPAWRVWECDEAGFVRPSGSAALYGPFTEVLEAEPVSAFLAEGSGVVVHRGERIG